MKTLGEMVQDKRDAHKPRMKAYELAKILDVKPPYITAIEKDRELPSLERFQQLNKVLGGSYSLSFMYHLYSLEQKISDKFLNKIKAMPTREFITQLFYHHLMSDFDSVSEEDIKHLTKSLILDFCPSRKSDAVFENNIKECLTESMTIFINSMVSINKKYVTVANLLLSEENNSSNINKRLPNKLKPIKTK